MEISKIYRELNKFCKSKGFSFPSGKALSVCGSFLPVGEQFLCKAQV